MKDKRPAKEIRCYESDSAVDPEDSLERVYEVTVPDERLHEVFSAYFNASFEAAQALMVFRERVTELGYRVHGYDGDDDFQTLAVDTMHFGEYSKDDRARWNAERWYHSNRLAESIWRNTISLFGFRGMYGDWLIEHGLGSRNEYGVVMPNFETNPQLLKL